MPPAQERGYSDELTRRQVLGGEIRAVSGVKFVEKREVRARNLHIDEIVHAHAGLLESGLNLVEQYLDFVADFGGALAPFIQLHASSPLKASPRPPAPPYPPLPL